MNELTSSPQFLDPQKEIFDETTRGTDPGPLFDLIASSKMSQQLPALQDEIIWAFLGHRIDLEIFFKNLRQNIIKRYGYQRHIKDLRQETLEKALEKLDPDQPVIKDYRTNCKELEKKTTQTMNLLMTQTIPEMTTEHQKMVKSFNRFQHLSFTTFQEYLPSLQDLLIKSLEKLISVGLLVNFEIELKQQEAILGWFAQGHYCLDSQRLNLKKDRLDVMMSCWVHEIGHHFLHINTAEGDEITSPEHREKHEGFAELVRYLFLRYVFGNHKIVMDYLHYGGIYRSGFLKWLQRYLDFLTNPDFNRFLNSPWV